MFYERAYAEKTWWTTKGRGSFSNRGFGPASKTENLTFIDVL